MDPEAAKIEHLKLIQSVIDRMARSSFALKAVAASVAAGLLAVAVTLSSPAVSMAGLALIPLWWLDGFYVSVEREYRLLFDEVRMSSLDARSGAAYFTLDRVRAGWKALLAAIFWRTVLAFHAPLVLVVFATGVVLWRI